MSKGYRQGRLGEEIRHIVSEMLLRELRDPRLDNMVSITAVNVTRDGSIATVYFSVMTGFISEESEEGVQEEEKSKVVKTKEERTAEVLEAFEGAKGLIRKEIGKKVKLRHTPDLLFKEDTSLEYGMHIEDLIRSIKEDS